MTAKGKDISVLLVDDDDIDRKTVRRAFRQLKIANPVHEARDGMEALAILRGTDGHARLETPYLILLDLAMPRMDGLEFLAELRNDEILNTALVFVLTTSKADEDRTAAYRKNVAGYIVKSDFGNEFMRVVEMIDHYWRVITFP
ncbi:MAG: response regulator [Pseudomonadales bacterium]|nr:response regulator [Pseudomonadales bacterium]